MGGISCPCPLCSAASAAGEAAVAHSDERVEALAQFQAACIRHALRFPALRRLVYSTCRCVVEGWRVWRLPG